MSRRPPTRGRPSRHTRPTARRPSATALGLPTRPHRFRWCSSPVSARWQRVSRSGAAVRNRLALALLFVGGALLLYAGTVFGRATIARSAARTEWDILEAE